MRVHCEEWTLVWTNFPYANIVSLSISREGGIRTSPPCGISSPQWGHVNLKKGNASINEAFFLAERAGFEPANLCGLHAFQACALSQTTRPLHFQRANYTMCYSRGNKLFSAFRTTESPTKSCGIWFVFVSAESGNVSRIGIVSSAA